MACFIISWCDSQLSDHHSVGAEFYQGFFKQFVYLCHLFMFLLMLGFQAGNLWLSNSVSVIIIFKCSIDIHTPIWVTFYVFIGNKIMSILIIYKSFINSLSKTINMVFSVYENMQNSARFNKKLETIKFGNTSAL